MNNIETILELQKTYDKLMEQSRNTRDAAWKLWLSDKTEHETLTRIANETMRCASVINALKNKMVKKYTAS